MKVKVYKPFAEVDSLEDSINEWIYDHSSVEVLDIKYSMSVDADGDTYYSAMIIYEE